MLLDENRKLVVIACSTGGPMALKSIIPEIPANMDAPIVIVQHMRAGFTKSLANRLEAIGNVKVHEVQDGMILEKGCIYVAPGGYQIRYSNNRNGIGCFKITKEEHISNLAPCADVFLESLAKSKFKNIMCCVLTGMGNDSAKGIRILKKKKSVYVVTQDKKSSTVYGMPRAVKNDGNSDKELPLEQIAKAIINYLEVQEDGCKSIFGDIY